MRPIWVIMDKRTRFLLPEPTGRMGRGGSHTEPEDPNKTQARFFYSELSARRALTAWLRGKHVAVMGGEQDDFSGRWISYQEDVQVIPSPDRIKENMEIVQLTMSY